MHPHGSSWMRLANVLTAVVCFLLVVWFITGFERPATAGEPGCAGGCDSGAAHSPGRVRPESAAGAKHGR